MKSIRTIIVATAASSLIAASVLTASADVPGPLRTAASRVPIVIKPTPAPTPRPKVTPSGRGMVPHQP